MIARRWVLSLLVLVASGGESGCHHHRARPTASAATMGDSLSGMVSITGTSLEQRIVLRTAERPVELVLSPTDSAMLSRLGGTEIVARGSSKGDGLHVGSFTVVRADGAPVSDGTLRKDGTHLLLQRANGEIPLGNPPAAFYSLIGARVWISGPLDTGPNSYGVIAPPH